MKNFLSLIALGLVINSFSFAATERLILSCEEKFSSLNSLEFFVNENGKVTGRQTYTVANKMETALFDVDALAWERKEGIQIPSWYGYERTLTFIRNNEWRIDFQDECSSKSIETTCTEFK